MTSASSADVIGKLRNPRTIRERAHKLLFLADNDSLEHFSLHREQLAKAVDLTVAVTKRHYPKLDIPYHSRWQHFNAGQIDRMKNIHALVTRLPAEERGVAYVELGIISVLLDAGAGDQWRFKEAVSNVQYSRSEGLAVASLELYFQGFFGLNAQQRVDAEALHNITDGELARAMQVTKENPLLGLDGRRALLNSLAKVIIEKPEFFPGKGQARLGNFFNYLVSKSKEGVISAPTIFACVLDAFSDIWPGRTRIEKVNLGDVWPHSKIVADDASHGLMPIHKLSQWLSYSLFEPLEWCGISVIEAEQLTGLAEYRNGGLLLDTGVLELRDVSARQRVFSPGDELIVEWRALTIALLDELARGVLKKLNLKSEDFPLVKVLQGGTWSAGREIAKQLRAGGGSPITINSDGTVF